MMKNSKILILLVFLFLISCKKTELKKVEDEKFIFGTSVKIVIYDNDEAKAKKLIKETFELMTKIESKYNSRNEESIVYKLNKNPTVQQKIDSEFYYLITEAIKVSEITKGKFDITIGPIMSLWGFDDLDIDKVPSKNEIIKEMSLVSYKDIKLNEKNIVLSKEGQKIDTGSFLKGYAIHKGKEYLESKQIKNAMITAISSIETIGSKPDGKAFKIGIQNPKDIGKLLYTIDLSGKALGVSGDYQTFVEIQGKKYHHIIDATTGYTSEYNSMVLVLGDNAFYCDLYSTSLFTMKPEEILEFLKNHKELEALIIDKNGKEYLSNGIKQYLEKIDEK